VNEEFEGLSSLVVSRHQHRFPYQACIFDRSILFMCLYTRVAVAAQLHLAVFVNSMSINIMRVRSCAGGFNEQLVSLIYLSGLGFELDPSTSYWQM
jgi:hypothetical protein